MSRILAIFRRDYGYFFRSPIGYVILAIFMFLYGLFFGLDLYVNAYSDIAALMSSMLQYLVLIILLPLITMRIFSEDRKVGTEILLLTSPSSVWEIVLGKYLAVAGVFLTMMASSALFPILTLAFGGKVDAQALGVYVGYLFLGLAFLSIGVFASALTENQVIAAVISVVTVVALLLLQSIASLFGNLTSSLLSAINVFNLTELQISNAATAVTTAVNWPNPLTRVDNYAKGIFELAPIVYFISVVAVFLFLTVRVIEKRRWSQG